MIRRFSPFTYMILKILSKSNCISIEKNEQNQRAKDIPAGSATASAGQLHPEVFVCFPGILPLCHNWSTFCKRPEQFAR